MFFKLALMERGAGRFYLPLALLDRAPATQLKKETRFRVEMFANMIKGNTHIFRIYDFDSEFRLQFLPGMAGTMLLIFLRRPGQESAAMQLPDLAICIRAGGVRLMCLRL